ncbi:riboflavin kinase [Mollicutes bacterium LVI A0039]|nr:riboflavin kinase [Mollicutes bacterium LVI A0039]
MKITNVNHLQIKQQESPRVVALGLFEAMHLGHVELIKTAVSSARANGYLATVVTVSKPVNKHGNMIFDIDHRIAKMQELGVEELIVIEMNDAVRNSDSTTFMNFLNNLDAKLLVCGADYRFGYLGGGDVELLKTQFEMVIPSFTLIDNQKVSTTLIKKSLQCGNIAHANTLLGYNYYIKGIVKKGKQLGRTIGAPTANIYPNISPVATGVYLTITTIDNNHYRSITNVGYNPTVGDNQLSVETYIGDGFNQEIYEQEIKVEMIGRIREEIKFNSIDELKARLKSDIKYMEEANYENC